jgi:light-regulated signal transduction histidine kinase (bacteriophytochrome)
VQEQDLARVLVYVFMQAFNDLLEKAKTLPSGYSPKLTIASAMKQGKVEMVIEDNGLGSTRKPREKTDVGERSTVFDLTACYQLVHRNHRGRMKVDSRPGAYTTVYISLPSESMATTLQG